MEPNFHFQNQPNIKVMGMIELFGVKYNPASVVDEIMRISDAQLIHVLKRKHPYKELLAGKFFAMTGKHSQIENGRMHGDYEARENLPEYDAFKLATQRLLEEAVRRRTLLMESKDDAIKRTEEELKRVALSDAREIGIV